MADRNGLEKEPILLDDMRLAKNALKDSVHAEALLRRIYPKIFAVVRTLAGSRKHADDIAQISAIEIMNSLNTYAGSGSIEAWAGQITYRVALKAIRKERVLEKKSQPIEDNEIAETTNPEDSISRRQLLDLLLQEMKRIPKKQRSPLLLHLAHGYTVDEIAEITQVSRNTVKYRLKAAYREMREILLEHPALRTTLLKEIS